jgi:PPOX class probable F420-dependent enzyme
MDDEEIDRFLHERHTMNVATHGPGGTIHLVAMWYGFLGANPAFETFGKSQKVSNLRRDPRVTVLVEDGHGYDELRGVELVGEAIIHDDEATLVAVARDVVARYFPVGPLDDIDALAAGLARKRVAVEIVATTIVSWDHRKLAGRY